MGGIAGLTGPAAARDLLQSMTGVMRHRAPGGVSHLSAGETHLGACLLGPYDSASSVAEGCGGAGARSAVFDGYLSNHHELRARLAARGHTLRGEAVTETLCHLHEEYGDAFVEHLEGEFACALAGDGFVLLARDRFGARPLYYAAPEGEGPFLFASEIKAVLQCEGLAPQVNRAKMADLVVPAYPVGKETFLRGVSSVRPGHVLRVARRAGRLQTEETARLRVAPAHDASVPVEAATERVSELLNEAVRSRLSGEEEVGLALSGGLDSTVVALVARSQCGARLKTYTVGGSPDDFDLKLARRTAELVGSEHHERVISFEEYVAAIPHFIQAAERPVLNVGTPFFLLCGEMAGGARTCVVGACADAVFGGGVDFLTDKKMRRQMEQGLERARAHGLELREEVAAFVSDICAARDFAHYSTNFYRLGLTDILFAGMHFYQAGSAAHGLELRDPFINRDLVDYVGSLPMGYKVRPEQLVDKYVLRRAALSAFGPAVYDAVLARKVGMGDPFRAYWRRFEESCEASLPEDYAARHPFGAFFQSKAQLVLFNLFELIFVQGRGRCPAGLDVSEFVRELGAAGRPARRSRVSIA